MTSTTNMEWMNLMIHSPEMLTLQQSNNNSNNQISFMTRNEGIASLVEDSVTLMAMMLVLIPVFIVYFKRHCYLLLGFLIRVTLLMGCCFCWGRSARTKLDDLIHEWKNNEKTKNREFFFVLLHTVIAFLLFRIPAEGKKSIMESSSSLYIQHKLNGFLYQCFFVFERGLLFQSFFFKFQPFMNIL